MTNTNLTKRAENGGAVEPVRRVMTYIPAVDILETTDELRLVADVPGVAADGVEINYERGELRLHARVTEREPVGAQWLTREYGVGDFVRTFRVGDGIDAARIEAEIADGVLTVHLPKVEAARSRKIAVKSR